MGITRFAAIVMVTIVLCIGCTSQMQHGRGEVSVDDESTRSATAGDQPAPPPNRTERIDSTDWAGASAAALAAIVELTDIGGFSVAVNAVGDPAVVATREPTSATNVMIAVLTAPHEEASDLALYTSAGSVRENDTDAFEIETIATRVIVDEIRTVSLTGTPSDSVGFSVIARKNDETSEFFVLPTETGSYVIRTPLSPVSRSVLRDITGSKTKELIQYSRVFEAGGKREIIIDSFQWVGDGFVHQRSLSLLRRVNERLSAFEQELETASIATETLQDALEASIEAPPITELILPVDAVVPEVSELLVDLGAAEWTIGHEIALVDDRREPFVYRIRLRLEANPYSASAVTILGVD